MGGGEHPIRMLIGVAKWGNSLAVRLPPAVVEALALKQGDQTETRVAADREFEVRRDRARWSYRSPGERPVRLAMRANMRGPISSPSWKAKTKSGQCSRCNVRGDPVCRLIVQPIRASAARTRLAFAAGQLLTRPGT